MARRPPARKKPVVSPGKGSGTGELRIIGGDWRSRKLRFPDAGGVRPSPARTRETLFNWLNFHLAGSRCLDLFAGSGALGMEALSRGAAQATLVDHTPALAKALRDNLRPAIPARLAGTPDTATGRPAMGDAGWLDLCRARE